MDKVETWQLTIYDGAGRVIGRALVHAVPKEVRWERLSLPDTSILEPVGSPTKCEEAKATLTPEK